MSAKFIKKIILSFVSLCQALLLAPRVSYKQLAYMAGALKPQEQRLSLAAGRAYLDWAKTAYQFGPSENSVIQLINDQKIGLFNLRDNVFRATASKTNPAYALRGPVAGRLLAGMVGPEKRIFTEKYNVELVDFWRDYFKKLTNSGLSKSRVEKSIDLIKRSIEEVEGPDSIFHPDTPSNMVMTQQVLHEQPFSEIIAMYRELKSLGIVDFSGDQEKLFEYYELEKFREQVDALRESAERQATLLTTKPELTIATEEYLKEKALELPAAPKQSSFCYKNSAESRPNCIETGLHDLVDLIVFDPQTKSFNPQKMLPSALSVSPKLVEFYNRHPQITQMEVNNARQDWFNLVSELPGIRYSMNNYELKTDFENQLAVLNHFFGTKAKNFEELGGLLSTPDQK